MKYAKLENNMLHNGKNYDTHKSYQVFLKVFLSSKRFPKKSIV